MANRGVHVPALGQLIDTYVDFLNASVEKALLGHILIDREIPEVLEFLELADLDDALNRGIHGAMRAVQARGEAVDLDRVLEQMRRDGTRNDLELAGGLFYLYECMDLYLALSGGPLYARRIGDLASKRRQSTTELARKRG